MIKPVHTFKAYFDYAGNQGRIKRIDVIYTAPDAAEAIRSALRFYQGREKAMPDWFGMILCLKVASYLIGPVDEYGALTNPGNFDFFEYKRDTAGLPLAEYVEYRCGQIEARLKKD